LSERQALALFILGGICLSGSWAGLDQLPVWARLSLLILLAFLGRGGDAERAPWRSPRAPGRPDAESAAAAFLVLAPVVAYLALTWGQEFPFNGDNERHMAGHVFAREFWAAKLPGLAFFAAVVWTAARARLLPWIIPAAFVGLWLWSWPTDMPGDFMRYPGGGYFLGLPAGLAARALDWDSPHNIARVSNVLSVAAWLFALRPFFVGRWPDRRLLPLAALFFWQKDMARLFQTAYLEPWAVVLALTAAERLLDSEGESALVCLLLIGAAAVVKEQAMLLLPFFWLAAAPGRGRSGLSRGAAWGAAAAAPFLVYYWLRLSDNPSRGFRFASASELFAPAYLRAYGARLVLEFGAPGFLALAGAAAGLSALLRRAEPGLRRRAAWLLGAAAFQLLFFFVDGNSHYWAGYPRFQMLAWAALGCALGVLGSGVSARAAWSAGLVGVLLNACLLAPELARAGREPDALRGFTEHFDDPFFLEIAGTARLAERRGVLEGIPALAVADRVGTDELSFKRAYHGLGRRYRLSLRPRPPSGAQPSCACVSAEEAVLVAFEVPVGLRPLHPSGLDDERFRPACLAEMRRTCRSVVENRHEGALLAVLGSGLTVSDKNRQLGR
jgi:hypothetical protein